MWKIPVLGGLLAGLGPPIDGDSQTAISTSTSASTSISIHIKIYALNIRIYVYIYIYAVYIRPKIGPLNLWKLPFPPAQSRAPAKGAGFGQRAPGGARSDAARAPASVGGR